MRKRERVFLCVWSVGDNWRNWNVICFLETEREERVCVCGICQERERERDTERNSYFWSLM